MNRIGINYIWNVDEYHNLCNSFDTRSWLSEQQPDEKQKLREKSRIQFVVVHSQHLFDVLMMAFGWMEMLFIQISIVPLLTRPCQKISLKCKYRWYVFDLIVGCTSNDQHANILRR